MLDIRRIRAEPEAVKAALARRGDRDVRQSTVSASSTPGSASSSAERDELRSQVKALSKQVGVAPPGRACRRGAEPSGREPRARASRRTALAAEAGSLADEIRELPAAHPQHAAPRRARRVPSEADNPVLRRSWASTPTATPSTSGSRTGRSASGSGILDIERAVKISGSMFTMQRRAGATLARALCQLALDRNADAFEEVRPPSLVTTETLTATGQLPKFADDAYPIERDDLWAIPTAEVPLTSIAPGRDPRRGRPARCGSWPTRRATGARPGRPDATPGACCACHEFDKVEMFAYATPEQAPDDARRAGRPGRGDHRRAGPRLPGRRDLHRRPRPEPPPLASTSRSTRPGCDQWLEVSSVSWFSDYQARRANIRYRPAGGGKGTEIVHTLNGSALAVPRVWAAIVETYRQPDGTIAVPEVLLPYFRGATTI